MAVPKKADRDEALDQLRAWMPKDSTVYTILRHVSRSGMQREIGLVKFIKGTAIHPNYRAAMVLGRRINKQGDGIVCGGAGMDMGFELVYSLAQKLYGNGYALNQRWL